MKTICKVVFLLVIVLTSCSKKPYTQRIKSVSDCTYCSSYWSWNNGVASIKDVDDGASFDIKAIISGDFSFSYKIVNDSYEDYIRVSGGVSYRDDVETGWKHVNAGHVDAGKTILVWGNNCSIKDIKIKGYIEAEAPEPEPQEPDVNPWDF